VVFVSLFFHPSMDGLTNYLGSANAKQSSRRSPLQDLRLSRRRSRGSGCVIVVIVSSIVAVVVISLSMSIPH
jgi:hypothetical protein